MQNIIEQVYDFNQQAGLLCLGYSDELESAFQIEEALEGFDLDVLHTLLLMQGTRQSPKDVARKIIWHTNGNRMTDVDRLDKACDAIVFAIGSMAKLGLTTSQIEQALNMVTTANLQKLGMSKDAYGKLIKPLDFVNPEPLLQQLLDER